MGRSTKPKYRIELTCISFTNKRKETHFFAYMVKEHGKPTIENAKTFRNGMNSSMKTGGSNEHLKGTISDYSNAYIIEQGTGDTVAEYIAPMFETV